MVDAASERHTADVLPSGDVIGLIQRQHAEARDLLDAVKAGTGGSRAAALGQLTALLRAHETAETIVLRPATRECVGSDVAAARGAEEKTAATALVELSTVDPDSEEFGATFTALAGQVIAHAEAEEREEHPAVLAGKSVAERIHLGKLFMAEYLRAGGPE